MKRFPGWTRQMKSQPFIYVLRNINIDHYFHIYTRRNETKLLPPFDSQDHNSRTYILFIYWPKDPKSVSVRKNILHDDVIKRKHFPRHWPFVRGIHRSPVNSLHKGQWRGALIFSLICVWINGWENNREADDLRRYRAHYDFIVMYMLTSFSHYHAASYVDMHVTDKGTTYDGNLID